MGYSIFSDKKSRPEEVELHSILGSTVTFWNEIIKLKVQSITRRGDHFRWRLSQKRV